MGSTNDTLSPAGSPDGLAASLIKAPTISNQAPSQGAALGLTSFYRQDDLALNVPLGSSLVRKPRVGKGIGAIEDDPDRACSKQASNLRQLRATRPDLSRRDRDAQLFRILRAGEAKRKDRKQCAARLQRAQKPSGAGSAHGVDHKIDVMRHVLGRRLGVVDERVGAEIAQKRLVLARRHGDDMGAFQLGDLHREMSDAASRSIDENGLAFQRYRHMRIRL